jgi:hypothetical protein
MESELSLLMVDAQLVRDGTPLTLSDPAVNNTTFTYTTMLKFGENDVGNYTCTATAKPHPTSTHLNGIRMKSDAIELLIGK